MGVELPAGETNGIIKAEGRGQIRSLLRRDAALRKVGVGGGRLRGMVSLVEGVEVSWVLKIERECAILDSVGAV
jgi:hypothetical protein